MWDTVLVRMLSNRQGTTTRRRHERLANRSGTGAQSATKLSRSGSFKAFFLAAVYAGLKLDFFNRLSGLACHNT